LTIWGDIVNLNIQYYSFFCFRFGFSDDESNDRDVVSVPDVPEEETMTMSEDEARQVLN
jgi:hypothetical protein